MALETVGYVISTAYGLSVNKQRGTDVTIWREILMSSESIIRAKW